MERNSQTESHLTHGRPPVEADQPSASPQKKGFQPKVLCCPMIDGHGKVAAEMLEKSDHYVVYQYASAEGGFYIKEAEAVLDQWILQCRPHQLLFDWTVGPGFLDTTFAFSQFPFEIFKQKKIRLPAMILFPRDPGAAIKAQCIDSGMNYLIAPFSFLELDLCIKAAQEKERTTQHIAWQDRRMTNAVVHIDKLKARMTLVEKRYNREKEVLHNSLKQINEMTREREYLKKDLRESRQALSNTVKGLFDFLSSMIDSRDDSRKGHTRRVGEIALFVADHIELDDVDKRDLKRAAMLHEVGMLMIPDHVLKKAPSALSRYERDMVGLHFQKGATYLEKCPGFEKTADIIRHLNENADGTGGPNGLKKRYIPLLSRILTGADELDQLWMDLCSDSKSAEGVVEILLDALEEHAGARIDPAIVNYLEKYVVTVLGQHRVQLREVAVSQLKPGMVIGTGLFTRTGTKLLTPGTRLTEDIIDRMIRYNREYPVDETLFIKVE